MYSQNVQPTFVLGITGLFTFIGYIIFIGGPYNLIYIIDDIKTVITVLFFGYIFSPLLYRLTDSVSTDTIFSLTFFVFFLNLIFFDYGLPAAIVSKPISVNSAIFGSICLASRLSSSHHAFVLLVVSVKFFCFISDVYTKILETHFNYTNYKLLFNNFIYIFITYINYIFICNDIYKFILSMDVRTLTKI